MGLRFFAVPEDARAKRQRERKERDRDIKSERRILSCRTTDAQ